MLKSIIKSSSLVACSALMLIAVSACSGSSSSTDHSQQTGAAALTVDVIELQRRSVITYENLPGRARASSEAEIRPQVTGLITERLFTEGETVTAGQPLYRIDSGDYRAAQASAKASLERAKAAAALSAETADRYRQLAEINAVSKQEYDEALASARQAEADIAIQKAALDTATLNLARTTIKSPIAGQIGRSIVTPGALVTQNQADPLARVVLLDPINADLTVASNRVLEFRRQVEEGTIETIKTESIATTYVPVTIQLDDGADYPHQGQLKFSEVSVDENSGMVAVRATVPNPDGLILPGMFLHAEFSIGKYENAIVLPQSAVSRDAAGDASVLLANAEGIVEQRVIKIETQSDGMWVVSSGLDSGDLVIVSHLQSIRAGTPVETNRINPDNLADSSPATPLKP